jgi:two-component system chemotaxis response regulator CheB
MPTAPENRIAPRLARGAFDVVVVASSAGGLHALIEVLSRLPSDFPACVLVVQHLSPTHHSVLASILSRRSKLAVKEAAAGDQIQAGAVFVAPANSHLLLMQDGTLSLTATKPVHYVRPSADLLFESAAECYGARAICVVLSGTGKDGAAGALAVKRMGGTVIAQDQASSEYFGMPQAAIEAGGVDLILPLQDVARTLVALVKAGD